MTTNIVDAVDYLLFTPCRERHGWKSPALLYGISVDRAAPRWRRHARPIINIEAPIGERRLNVIAHYRPSRCFMRRSNRRYSNIFI